MRTAKDVLSDPWPGDVVSTDNVWCVSRVSRFGHNPNDAFVVLVKGRKSATVKKITEKSRLLAMHLWRAIGEESVVYIEQRNEAEANHA